MGKIIDFFGGGWMRWALLALILTLAIAFMRMHWIQTGREQILRENAAAAVKIITKQGAVTERVVTEYVKVAGKTKIVTEYVDKEVVKYAETNSGLCLDADWRRLHDSAALNALPKSGRQPDGKGGTSAAASLWLRSAYSLASFDDSYGKLR